MGDAIRIIIFTLFGVLALWCIAKSMWDKFIPPKCRHGYRKLWSWQQKCENCTIEWANSEQLRHMKEKQQRLEAQRKERAVQIEIDKERIEEAIRLRDLAYIKTMTPTKFEEVVLQAYRNQGWSADATPVTGDDGVDGRLYKGGKLFILQCKRFTKNNVGAPAIRDLLGTVKREDANGGVLVTTSSFTQAARRTAEEQPIELIDGNQLIDMVRLAFPNGQLVPEDFVVEIIEKRKRPNICPECGQAVREVKGKYGPFLGCVRYPDCKWTMSIGSGKNRGKGKWRGRF
ncbi:MAG: restriction endonuclease [Phycisphaeraceae bacterium]